MLVVPDCPNQSLALARVHAALEASGISDSTVHETTVVDLDHAVTVGMHGSPTILINGRDPFADQGSVSSISCRLYRPPAGTEGCPGVQQLIDALRSSAS